MLIFCLSSLTSCLVIVKDKTGEGKVPETDAESETVGETAGVTVIPPLKDILEQDEEKIKKTLGEMLGDKTYEGKTFTIIMIDEVEVDIKPETETSYSRAFAKRYEILKEKLKCDMQFVKVDKNTFLTEARTAASAGMHYADMACIPQNLVGYLHLYGIALDLNSAAGDVFAGESYVGDAKAQSSGVNSFYALSGYGALSPDTYECVYFNKFVTDSYGITDKIFASFLDGSWTWDKMAEFRASCIGGAYDGMAMINAVSNDVLIEGMFTSSGMKFLKTGLGVQPAAEENGDRALGVIARLKQMISDANTFNTAPNGQELLESGNTLFYIDTLAKAPLLKCNFGILPIPKLDSAQTSYYTYANPESHVMVVLAANTDRQASIDFLRAYNEASLLIKDGWLRDYLDYVLYDPTSYKAVENIFANLSFDFAYMYNESSIPVSESSIGAFKRAVVGNYDFAYATYANQWKLITEMRILFK